MEQLIRQLDFAGLAADLRLKTLYFITVLYDWQAKTYQLLFGIREVEKDFDFSRLQSQLLNFLNTNGIMGFDTINIVDEPREEIEQLLDWQIRPYAQSHGGDIILQDFDEKNGLVLVYLQGMCSSCSSALITMSHGVESMFKTSLPWIKQVKASNLPQDPDFGFEW